MVAKTSKHSILMLLDLMQDILLHLDNTELYEKALAKIGATHMVWEQEMGQLLD